MRNLSQAKEIPLIVWGAGVAAPALRRPGPCPALTRIVPAFLVVANQHPDQLLEQWEISRRDAKDHSPETPRPIAFLCQRRGSPRGGLKKIAQGHAEGGRQPEEGLQ